MRGRHGRWLGALLVLIGNVASAAEEKPLLAQQPTLSKTTIVFS